MQKQILFKYVTNKCNSVVTCDMSKAVSVD